MRLDSFADPINACVIGASGGIGGALVAALAASDRVSAVYAGARHLVPAEGKVRAFQIDLLDEQSITDAASAIPAQTKLNLIIVATGILHDGPDFQPEKGYRMQGADAYARAFAINATGPALVAKHFLPLLPRERKAVFAALSARVSSISDNQLGGWHAYRASKAALNMIFRNLAIELGRTHKDSIAVTLHPGTVDTALSAPFQRNLPAGQLSNAQQSAAHLLTVIDQLQATDSGGLFAWDGTRIPY